MAKTVHCATPDYARMIVRLEKWESRSALDRKDRLNYNPNSYE